MKIIKHILLWGLSLFSLFTFSAMSLANTTTNQAGISFTEMEEVEKEKEIVTFQKNKILVVLFSAIGLIISLNSKVKASPLSSLPINNVFSVPSGADSIFSC